MNSRAWIFVPFLMMPVIHAAELKPETVNAWDLSVQAADAAMKERLRAGNAFLWTDEEPQRRHALRAGEILVTGVGERNPKKVPSGLIHHWMGAAFIPNAKLDDVLGVVRNYARYKDYYNPTVVDSRAISQAPGADRFSTLLMNKALFLKMALENEYESSYIQAGPHRWYSIAKSIRVQEIEDYGQRSEHKLPLDQGSGYIWRLHGITRFEEADGGVYIEIEAMALSREIPAAMRWVADPIVRRVSRGSLITSLRQTQDAVNSFGQVATAPLGLGQVPNPPVALGFTVSASQH